MKILYIDDNRLLMGCVKNVLDTTYTVDTTCTGVEGIEKALSIQYDIILLDLGLPDMEGLEVCRKLRKLDVAAPILILTVQNDPALVVKLLNCGADDYLTKPFNTNVLEARIAALLRRGQNLRQEKIIEISDLIVNLTRREVWRAGTRISLRRKEFDVLEYLVSNSGRVLTRSMILDHVWEIGTTGWSNTVDVHIKHIRDKIDRPFDTSLIKTAYGIGYTLNDV